MHGSTGCIYGSQQQLSCWRVIRSYTVYNSITICSKQSLSDGAHAGHSVRPQQISWGPAGNDRTGRHSLVTVSLTLLQFPLQSDSQAVEKQVYRSHLNLLIQRPYVQVGNPGYMQMLRLNDGCQGGNVLLLYR